VDWTHLGHAGWLAEAARLRLLFDPVLDDPHQGGTYGVWPPRRVNAEALRPDFLVISHAHPDHFDVRSMARLARLDADVVVVTPDQLVADVARRVGFRVVNELPAGQRITLDGAVMTLTPSHAPDPEWGVVLSTAEGVVWNQVDTVLGSVDEVRRVAADASDGRGVDLALVRWAPLLEIEAQVPGSLAFPFRAYAETLDHVAAIAARAVVPAAAGQRHLRGRWLDHVVWPVTPERALVDLAARCAPARVMPAVVGGTLRLRGGGITLDPSAGSGLVEVDAAAGPDPRIHRALEVPAVEDGSGEPDDALAAVIEPWLHGALVEALHGAWRSMQVAGPVRLGLEVVFPSGTRGWTFHVGDVSVHVASGLDPELDVLNVVAASALRDVLEGRRAWGHVLLAGELRSSQRAYRVTAAGLHRAAIAPVFLYYALSYTESARRAVLRELDAVLAGAPPPWLSVPRGEAPP
jgi:hypothetical protein